MTTMTKGLLLGAIQLALVLSLGGKLLYDRATRPTRLGADRRLRSRAAHSRTLFE